MCKIHGKQSLEAKVADFAENSFMHSVLNPIKIKRMPDNTGFSLYQARRSLVLTISLEHLPVREDYPDNAFPLRV